MDDYIWGYITYDMFVLRVELYYLHDVWLEDSVLIYCNVWLYISLRQIF